MISSGGFPVASDFPAGSIENLSVELERARESSARLLRTLGQKMAAVRTMPVAAGSTLQRAVRRRPGAAILFAAAAGFLLARLLRPKLVRETHRV